MDPDGNRINGRITEGINKISYSGKSVKAILQIWGRNSDNVTGLSVLRANKNLS
jgi:hypothetical protein